MNSNMELSDADLIIAFEQGMLPHEAWTHRAHVRVGYLYASQYGLEGALTRMREGLQRLNAAHGVPDVIDRGFHETITVAFMRLIVSACRQQAIRNSAEFCDANPELMTKDALQ